MLFSQSITLIFEIRNTKREVTLMNAVYAGWYNSEHALNLATAQITATRFLSSNRE